MTEKEDPSFVERFTVRMPDGMRDAIAARAKENGRSMNSEIVQIIEDALTAAKIEKNRNEILLLKHELQALDFEIGMRSSHGESVGESVEKFLELDKKLDELTGGKAVAVFDDDDPDMPPIVQVERRLSNIEGILMELFKDKLKSQKP